MPWLLPTAAQTVERAPAILGQTEPTRPCAASHDEMFIWFICCAACANSPITLPISGETLSIASLKAKPSALFAVALSSATISEALMKENEPENRSMPPQPARALGSWRLKGWTLFCGKRVQTLPIE